MAQSIQSSDVGPDLLYWLGTNPKEADRISRLNPILQAKEIGKIEAGLASNPPVKKTSTAPAPIAPPRITIDREFWAGMVAAQRASAREARQNRYAGLRIFG